MRRKFSKQLPEIETMPPAFPLVTKEAGLAALGVEAIKFYPGQEQVDLSVEIEVPGSWFNGTAMGSLTTTERRQKYKAQAVEFAEVREFPAATRGGKKSRESGIRFLCIEDAADDPHSVGYWMKLSQWNRYRHDTFKSRPEDELIYIRALPSASLLDTAAAAKNEPSKLKAVFEKVSTGVHTQKDGVEVPCSYYKCTQPNCKSRGEMFKEIRAGSGQLSRHLKKCNHGLWREIMLTSKHSKIQLGEDGEVVELWSFEESLPSYVRFVEHCFLEWEVFNRVRSVSLRAWATSLNKRSGLPHRNTCIKILGIIRTLVQVKLQAVIAAHAKLRLAPHAGQQSDIWSEKSMRQSFFALRLSIVLEPHLIYSAGSTGMTKHAGTLIDAAPMLDFAQFTNTSHSAVNVAAIKTKVLGKYGLKPTDISLATEDGASNNKKSAELLGQPFKVCFPHNLQRAVLFSTGMTGNPCLNPDLKQAIGAMSRMAAAPHRSVQVTSAMQEVQIADGTPKSRVLSTCSMNATRWQGLYRMVNKNRRLQKELSIALTGSEGGGAAMAEEPAAVGGEAAAGAAEADDKDMEVEDEDEEEEFEQDDEDEDQIQANFTANKKFPLAHRLLDDEGFKNNSLLESMLTHPNEVSCLVQKHEGMGLSLGYQMAMVLHSGSTNQRVQVVSGTSKEGAWKDMNASSLPHMFKKQREIFAKQIEDRFKVKGTPDKHTLLALMMDPSLDTTEETGIFADRPAAQTLMVGEYHRRLLRRLQLMRASDVGRPDTGAPTTGSPAQLNVTLGPPGKRAASPAPPLAPKRAHTGPASVLSLIGSKAAGKAPLADDIDLLDVVKLEESKYASVCIAVCNNPSDFMVNHIFDQALFWAGQKAVLPIHYNLWLAEVGCVKVASANVETVFSGAGRISMKSRTLDPQLLSDYAFLHYNYKYDWLRPTLDEIITAYKKLYGKQQHESDAEDSEEEEEQGEEGGEEEEEEGE